ncbi:carboxymuconolactone decarboxylase family protein [Cupriavidus sp. AU9028]|uniref:carboxymuconolactone decarboxylase family protein n=1 Tax=Cupriavidus sp. AU9028 TaxID=2871157 RepID=UPI001C93E790|nr:carboxymuconolactone decarboxylase family protein [Cupriavidus sp. AU9028]MBY4895951.1 carboxymuconolactone decarboxylase family protein [Cupriavidus sp. AU9028]
MSAPRLPWTTLAPAQYKSLAGVNQALASSSLGGKLIELVQTRVSQINGCAFCIDMHVRDLRKAGESWQRLSLVAAWREAGDVFTARERAALQWAETMTRLPDNHIDRGPAFEALREHFNEKEIVELTWVVAAINAWNRMAIGMHNPIDGRPME